MCADQFTRFYSTSILLDSIENNIDRTQSHVEEGRQQLEKASSHQVISSSFLMFYTNNQFI